MVGAVLVKKREVIGRGWHRAAGQPHAEIEALQDAGKRGINPKGATLYVTLEPCCTHGRTPPCTEAVIAAEVKKVVVAARDPNPQHAGRGYTLLESAGIEVIQGVLESESARLNESFNHWIVHRTPFVTVKAAMTLDGKIATAAGESKWITGERSRLWSMRLRKQSDAILTGVNTILADDPSLTCRLGATAKIAQPRLRRIILDSRARIPLHSRVLCDDMAHLTTLVATAEAPEDKLAALAQKATVWRAPAIQGRVDLQWLLRRLGEENVTSLLVEGGGEVNGSFIGTKLAHRVAFFYAPLILGGRDALKGVAGEGLLDMRQALNLSQIELKSLGEDLFYTALVAGFR
jgi:diaminohydroxyphosphoribosylaminopyrimidine deaminase/5-amino-6-(5-phosphoribosylamino)uracil reductase